ncbi:MAG: L,D-transpeptidase [Shimia sp.]
MIARDPDIYGPSAGGVEGGSANPLGSRAVHLYEGDLDTYLRIHDAPEPDSIGGRASAGRARMVISHIKNLDGKMATGVTANPHPPKKTLGAV